MSFEVAGNDKVTGMTNNIYSNHNVKTVKSFKGRPGNFPVDMPFSKTDHCCQLIGRLYVFEDLFIYFKRICHYTRKSTISYEIID